MVCQAPWPSGPRRLRFGLSKLAAGPLVWPGAVRSPADIRDGDGFAWIAEYGHVRQRLSEDQKFEQRSVPTFLNRRHSGLCLR